MVVIGFMETRLKEDNDIKFSIDWFHKWIEAIKMKLPNSMPSQVNATFALNRLYNLKLPVFKLLGERTNHSENESISHPNVAWYVERNSSRDINPMSYHLLAFELINQPLHINFPSLERKIFLKDLSRRCRRLLRCRFVTSVLSIWWGLR